MSRHTFEASFRRAVRWHWPNADDDETSLNVAEQYISARYGHPDYDWSNSAAAELAALYVSDFGEAT